MCYLLTITSPLTLSEVRSMLPEGLAAHPVGAAEAAADRRLLPGAQTVATLVVGSCSCDLLRPRLSDPREDERPLRARYSRLGLSREAMIRDLARHRRHGMTPEPAGGWAGALAAFVAEHARNAGATLYRLRFEPGGTARDRGTLTRTVAEVRARPAAWLEEDRPVLVAR